MVYACVYACVCACQSFLRTLVQDGQKDLTHASTSTTLDQRLGLLKSNRDGGVAESKGKGCLLMAIFQHCLLGCEERLENTRGG